MLGLRSILFLVSETLLQNTDKLKTLIKQKMGSMVNGTQDKTTMQTGCRRQFML